MQVNKRNDPENEGLFCGVEGLWSAVLSDILVELEKPTSHARVLRIITDPESGSLPVIAAALGLPIEELQKKIFRHLQKKGGSFK